MSTYKRRFGDRKEGRLLRSLPAFSKFIPYIMPTRNDACNSIQTTFEISKVERYIRQKRAEGMESFGLTHVLLAAYVRCIAKYPGVNRFFSGQRVYQRDDDVQFTMTIKKDMRTDGEETTIKLHLKPTDTTKEVYEKLNDLIDEAAGHGFLVRGTSVDQCSGNTLKDRDGLRIMMESVKQNIVEAVMVRDLAQISRNSYILLGVIEIFRQYDVYLITTECDLNEELMQAGLERFIGDRFTRASFGKPRFDVRLPLMDQF